MAQATAHYESNDRLQEVVDVVNVCIEKEKWKELETLSHLQKKILADAIKEKALNTIKDPITVFHMVRLAETIGSIADHAENAGDMMRAMIAK